jgi:sugar transferase (PEP-CTERM/EpsH1 system associated)
VAEYLFRVEKKDQKGDAPWKVMDFCDVDSDKWRQYAQKSPFPMNLLYRMEHRRMTAYERRVNRYFDCSVFVSRPEARLFKETHPQATDVSVVTNGVDHHFFSPDAAVEAVNINGPMLMFAGAMDYHANVDGVRWFAGDILPDIRKSFPEAHFYIVGNNPHKSVRELAGEGAVTVTGYVEDIRSYHLAAEVFVVPLRIARGVQNKVLEAMAMGKAVVTTSMAIQGIHPRPEEYLMVADGAKEFAASVTQLLSDADLRSELGRKARGFIERHYKWDACMSDMEGILGGAVERELRHLAAIENGI